MIMDRAQMMGHSQMILLSMVSVKLARGCTRIMYVTARMQRFQKCCVYTDVDSAKPRNVQKRDASTRLPPPRRKDVEAMTVKLCVEEGREVR